MHTHSSLRANVRAEEHRHGCYRCYHTAHQSSTRTDRWNSDWGQRPTTVIKLQARLQFMIRKNLEERVQNHTYIFGWVVSTHWEVLHLDIEFISVGSQQMKTEKPQVCRWIIDRQTKIVQDKGWKFLLKLSQNHSGTALLMCVMTRIAFSPLSQEHMQAICTINVGFRLCSLHTSGFSKPGGLHLLVPESKANKLINTIFTWAGQGKQALKCYTIT